MATEKDHPRRDHRLGNLMRGSAPELNMGEKDWELLRRRLLRATSDAWERRPVHHSRASWLEWTAAQSRMLIPAAIAVGVVATLMLERTPAARRPPLEPASDRRLPALEHTSLAAAVLGLVADNEFIDNATAQVAQNALPGGALP